MYPVKMTKGEDVKFASCEAIQNVLEEAGWTEDGKKPAKQADDEKDAIKAQLDKLGVKYHPNTGLEKLKEALAKASE